MTDKTDALEDLVPFAEAVLALRDASAELQRTKRSLEQNKTEHNRVNQLREQALQDYGKATQNAIKAREDEATAKRGIEEANKEREAILAKAEIDAQAAYDAQLVQKQGSLDSLDQKIIVSTAKLTDTERAIVNAQDRLAGIERQITTLRSQFS